MTTAWVTVTIIFIVVIFIFALLKLFLKLNRRGERIPTCLVGKTAIVTGANTGIGYYTALDFAKRGARVILACRNKKKAEEARDRIIEDTGNSNVIVKIVDFAALGSVRAFAREINVSEERLDILVNNAGAVTFDKDTSIDGLNLLMQVNHFGPFLLTLCLVDLLKRSAPSRIINVSSVLSYLARLDPNNLNAVPSSMFFFLTNYSNTKFCNILFTNELARRLKDSGVVANSLHPGLIRTDIFRHVPSLAKRLIDFVTAFLFESADKGAQTSIYVAVAQDLNDVSGEYFDNCRIAWLPSMPRAGRNEDLAKTVWEKSEDFVKLTPEERSL